MAIRQYIGARYVPKFYENSLGTNEWTANTAYEPLTIVTRNGNSYTSKKEVPANIGAPETAPEYWASTGIYNQQIDMYREEVNQLREDVTPLIDRKFAIITDSYGLTFENVSNPWPVIFGLRAGLTLNTDLWYEALNGASFANNVLYTTALQTLANRMTAAERESVTDLLVAGGCNDAAMTYDNIRAGMSTFINAARAAYPNANIYVACIGGFSNNITSKTNIAFNSMAAYSTAGDFGARYLTNVDLLMTNNYLFQADHVHPNQTGMNRLGSAVYMAMFSDYAANGEKISGNMELNSEIFTGGALPFVAQATGDIINVCFRTNPSLSCASRTLTGGVKLASAANIPYILGNTDMQTVGLITVNGTNGGTYPAAFTFLEKNLYVNLPYTFENVTSISINRMNILMQKHFA